MQTRSAVRDRIWLSAIEVLVAFGCGLCFVAIGAGGGAWILSGIAAGALVFYVYRSRRNAEAQPSRTARKIGQVLVGLTVGFSVQAQDVPVLSTQLPIFALLTLSLIVSGGLIGYLYAYLQKTDLLTAVLATVPGNIGVMASVAADYDRDPALVSLVQLIRFTTIILIIPLIAQIPNSHDVSAIFSILKSDANALTPASSLLLLFVFAATIAVVQVATRLKVPVATFIGAIVAGAAFNYSLDPAISFHLPLLVKLIGQILLGLTIGEYWAMNPKLGRWTIATAIFPVVLTFVAGVAAAAVAKSLTNWDWLTCLLVTAPGGSPEMIWIALTLHRNVEVVTASHLVRLLTINFLLPGLITFVTRCEPQPSDQPVSDRQ